MNKKYHCHEFIFGLENLDFFKWSKKYFIREYGGVSGEIEKNLNIFYRNKILSYLTLWKIQLQKKYVTELRKNIKIMDMER